MKTLIWGVSSAILLVEFLSLSFRLNFWRRRANAVEHAALTYADTHEERTKEKLVISAGLNLLGLVLYVMAILAFFFLVIWRVTDLSEVIDSLYLWSMSSVFIAYSLMRSTWLKHRKMRQQQHNFSNQPNIGYNRIARFMHWLALEFRLVRKASFEVEKAIYLKKASCDPRVIDQPVYLMGLARSGTTVALEILEKTGSFNSPTYRNMPFILCPNFWQGLTMRSRLNAQLANRAHGDGIAIGFDSPESFEEVFWRTAIDMQPGSALAYASISQDTLADFAAYRQVSLLSALQNGPRLLQTPNNLRYLSKNNNNVLRLNHLSAQPHARVILFIRDPLATAWSLYRQHQSFLQIQADDTFVRSYMRWLGHHEFGQGHKPLVIGTQHLHGMDPTKPDYWLAYWLGIYQNLWQTFETLPQEQGDRILWMSHERMRQEPAQALNRLFAFVNIDLPTDTYTSMLRPVETIDLQDQFDHNLIQRASDLHRNVLESTLP